MAGTVVADTLQSSITGTPVQFNDGTGTQIGTLCRAWVNFDGTTNTGGFCTIRGSFNVTSVADNGTGNYTVNFTTAMPDVNYSTVVGCNQQTMRVATAGVATTSVNVLTGRVADFSGNVTLADGANSNVAIFR